MAKPTCPEYIAAGKKNDPAHLSMQGVACFETGDFSRALTYYGRALELAPTPMLHGAMGRAFHELGLYSLAAFYYNGYLEDVPTDSDGARRIRERLATLQEQETAASGKISIVSAPSKALVYLVMPNQDWFELGPTPLTISAKEGNYRFVIVEPDHHRQIHDVTIAGSADTIDLSADLIHENSTFDVSARQWRRAGAWTMVSSAPILLGGITLLVLGHQSTSRAKDYNPETTGHSLSQKRDLHDKGDTLQRWGIITTGIGGAGLLTGAILYSIGLSSSKRSEPAPLEEPAASIIPVLSPSQLGVRFTW
ncbi:MAG: tetratricopeptide repeat protein [Bradymonadaceae bacterium]|nr:tetratricopeptide repeat protein [Lujinxingiaceae bacterium]